MARFVSASAAMDAECIAFVHQEQARGWLLAETGYVDAAVVMENVDRLNVTGIHVASGVV